MPAWSRRSFLRAATGLALLAAVPAWAEGIQPRRVDLVARGEGYQLIGGFDIELNPKLEEALKRGVAIPFVQDFELERPRDYWLAEGVAEASRPLKLSHNALLRSYSLSVAGGTRNFDNLSEALAAAGHLGDWAVLDPRLVKKKGLYRARVRMYVDTSQLPKPLQVNAFASDRWQMDSGYYEWIFKP